MKQKDIALLAVVIIASGVLSFFLGKILFNSPKSMQVQAEVVEPISTDFNASLDKKYFNSESINPTYLIQIGSDSNVTPFSEKL